MAAFIHLNYSEGQVVSLEISLVEAQEARQWALATSSKTVFLDECDTRSPLKIISSSSEPASQASTFRRFRRSLSPIGRRRAP